MIDPCSCSDKDTSDAIIQIIGIIVLIITFITERVITHYSEKKQSKNNWYLSVIIIPNLSKIDLFFNFTFEVLLESERRNRSLWGNTPNLANNYLSNQTERFQNKKVEFELEFIKLIETYNFELGLELLQLLNEVEDIVVETLGTIDFMQVTISDRRRQIFEKKGNFYSKLYSKLDQKDSLLDEVLRYR